MCYGQQFRDVRASRWDLFASAGGPLFELRERRIEDCRSPAKYATPRSLKTVALSPLTRPENLRVSGDYSARPRRGTYREE